QCATGACIRSFDVDTAANTVKSDDFSLAGTQLFYGASGFDKYGNMWLLSASAKPAGFVGLALAGRSATGQVRAPREIVADDAAAGGRRARSRRARARRVLALPHGHRARRRRTGQWPADPPARRERVRARAREAARADRGFVLAHGRRRAALARRHARRLGH